MNNNEKMSFLKGKGAAVALVLCFASVIAMVGAFTYNNYQKSMEQQLAEAEEQTEDLTKRGKVKQRRQTTSCFQKQNAIHPIQKRKRMKQKRLRMKHLRRKQKRAIQGM